eukprot:CAMPEP_0174981828 /NCGR_PEP_ID=MMETSP0004_2-20121128/16120_1 /TAXON_ID=420556 /ORGANISM="Ochromonas sp., Strain CCMP1393" /LENGTH=728 /DNA_ID=CAMNT_0016233643 /DNA_START=101 /DNA_END=2287 /DNA_ORIENTATION=+
MVMRDSEWQRSTGYDFCMVFPAENGNFTERGNGYIKSLKKLDFEMYAYSGVREDQEIFVLVRTPLKKLQSFADRIGFKMKLNSAAVREMLERGNEEENIGPIDIPHRPDVTQIEPYEFIYGPYTRSVPKSLYEFGDGYKHPFSDINRLTLASLILESRLPDGSQNLKIRRYLRNGWLLACFPLHDKQKARSLTNKWQQFPFSLQLPLDEFRDYFGQKCCMYFQFVQYFATSLVVPAVVGVPLQITVLARNDFSAPFLPYYSFFIALWAVTMLEFWKRKEKTIALQWGSIDFEEHEVDRPDFRGEWIQSFIDGSKVRYFPSRTRTVYIRQSTVAIISLVLLVGGLVASIYVLRYELVELWGISEANAQIIASVANAVQIQVLNYVYTFIATALSERENHRTDTQFEDSMIVKLFLFQFVNSYSSFFFLAFVAEAYGDCSHGECMRSLAVNVFIIFGSRLFSGNLLELVIPYISYRYKYREEMKTSSGIMSVPEKEFLLDQYDQLSASIEDYADVAITYGYTALFVTALPMASLLALISIIFEIRSDGFKLLNLFQRPFPKGCEDIGTWQDIFLLLSVAAVITNAGLITFTMTTLDRYSTSTKFWIFVLFQWVCFALQFAIMEAIPDVPEQIIIQQKRMEFITSKLIEKIADGKHSDVEGAQEPLIIHQGIENATAPADGLLDRSTGSMQSEFDGQEPVATTRSPFQHEQQQEERDAPDDGDSDGAGRWY